jgi:predicted GNAT family acetyltransferase
MVRVLDDQDGPAVVDLLAGDPVGNVFVASRVEHSGCDPWRLGAQLWGYPAEGRLRALCYAGANLVPVVGQADTTALDAFVERARRQGRRCSSIVGAADAVHHLWERLEPHWGTAREVRANQPLLAIDRPSAVDPDPSVRRVRPEELDVVMPACVAMFTEEVGVSPLADGGVMYRQRVNELIASGRALARIDAGRVVFKAEVGAVTQSACQVQGVWVDPELRGRGLSEAGMAAVVAICLRDLAPVVSLYVNDFNVAARRSYERVGFRQVGTFASVLF